MNTKTVVLCILSAAGCGSVSDSRMIGDAGIGSDAGSDAGSDQGSDTTPPPPGAIYGHVYDERNDAIDFSSGVPVHAHSGAPIDLSTGCPDVYKYAYLMDDHAPVYGSELIPNPLAFHIDAPSATSAMYRVRSEIATIRDWTPMSAASGSYMIALHRNDTEQMHAIGNQVGTFYVDAKIVDANGETTKTACWRNHPMAAPLSIQPVQPGYVFGMTFAKHSFMDLMMNGQSFPEEEFGSSVVRFNFDQQTAEPVSINVRLAARPTATGMKEIVTEYIPSTSYTVDESCGTSLCPTAPLPIHATTTNQALGGAWELVADDNESTDWHDLCRQAQGSDTVVCQIPGRAAGQAVHAYSVSLLLANADAVAPNVANPAWNTFESRLINSIWFVGQFAPSFSSYCSAEITKFGAAALLHYCTQRTYYQQVNAVNQAKLAFDPITLTIATSLGETGTAMVPPYLAPSAMMFGAHSWDAGGAGL